MLESAGSSARGRRCLLVLCGPKILALPVASSLLPRPPCPVLQSHSKWLTGGGVSPEHGEHLLGLDGDSELCVGVTLAARQRRWKLNLPPACLRWDTDLPLGSQSKQWFRRKPYRQGLPGPASAHRLPDPFSHVSYLFVFSFLSHSYLPHSVKFLCTLLPQ